MTTQEWRTKRLEHMQNQTKELIAKTSEDISLILKRMPDQAEQVWKLFDDYDKWSDHYAHEGQEAWCDSLAFTCLLRINEFISESSQTTDRSEHSVSAS